jgi:hypothetical protein
VGARDLYDKTMNNEENGLKCAQGWKDMRVSAITCHIWWNCFLKNRGKNEGKRAVPGVKRRFLRTRNAGRKFDKRVSC